MKIDIWTVAVLSTLTVGVVGIGSKLTFREFLRTSVASLGLCLFGNSCDAIATSGVDSSKDVIVQLSPFEKSLDGTAPSTGEYEFGTTAGLRVGLWEHTVGTSTQENDDEVFVVLRGKGRIILEDGTVLVLKEGTVGRLMKGQNRRWEIDSDLRKVWITNKNDGVL